MTCEKQASSYFKLLIIHTYILYQYIFFLKYLQRGARNLENTVDYINLFNYWAISEKSKPVFMSATHFARYVLYFAN